MNGTIQACTAYEMVARVFGWKRRFGTFWRCLIETFAKESFISGGNLEMHRGSRNNDVEGF